MCSPTVSPTRELWVPGSATVTVSQSAAASGAPIGVPSPVARSYPGPAGNRPPFALRKSLSPVVTSLKVLAYAPLPATR